MPPRASSRRHIYLNCSLFKTRAGPFICLSPDCYSESEVQRPVYFNGAYKIARAGPDIPSCLQLPCSRGGGVEGCVRLSPGGGHKKHQKTFELLQSGPHGLNLFSAEAKGALVRLLGTLSPHQCKNFGMLSLF